MTVRVDSRWGRVARGWSAAGFATIVAAVSHTLGGGVPPTAFAIVVSLVLSGMACTLLAGRTLSVFRLGASVAVSQALFHGLFSGLGTPVAVAHAHVPTVLEAGAEHHPAGMWGAHIVAGIITLVALRYAETAFWGLAATARLFFARLIATASIPAPLALDRHRIIPILTVLPSVSARILPRLRYRGPPALAGAL